MRGPYNNLNTMGGKLFLNRVGSVLKLLCHVQRERETRELLQCQCSLIMLTAFSRQCEV